MKYKELDQLPIEDLKNKLEEVKKKHRDLKFAHSISQIEKPHTIREQRRLIAKIITNMKAKKLAAINTKKNGTKTTKKS